MSDFGKLWRGRSDMLLKVVRIGRGPVLLVLLAWLIAGCSPKYACYRFDDHYEDTVSVDGPDGVPETKRHFVSLTGGWTSEKGSGQVEESASGLVFTTNKMDRLKSPAGLRINGLATDVIVLKMKVSGTDTVWLRWIPEQGTFNDWRALKIDVPAQNEMLQYDLHMSNVRPWRHRRNDQLLFEAPTKARIEIESIELIDRRAPFGFATMGVIHYSVNDKLRPCVFNHCPATLRYRLRLPAHPVFRAGLSVVEPSSPVTFQLVVKMGGEVKTIFTKEVYDPGHWDDVEVDLSTYAGRKIELWLISYNKKRGQVALWSNPAVFERYDGEGGGETSRRPPNIVLYVIDCLRPDHMQAYGYERATTPNLSEFAAGSVKFTRCFAVDTWTRSSTTSFSTGVDHLYHGVEGFDVMPEKLTTFPELLRLGGYETCAITENPHTPPETMPRASYSFLEPVHLRGELGQVQASWQVPEITGKLASEFIRKHEHQPFFLYIHTMEPHEIRQGGPETTKTTYEPPDSYRPLFGDPANKSEMDLYDAAVRFADENFGRFVKQLEEAGVMDNTVVIVTADHGEGFGEHENHFRHYGKPYNTLTHVPLLIRWPERLPGGLTINENVSLLDLAPTIIEFARLTPAKQLQGRSLIPLMGDGPRDGFRNRMIVSKWTDTVAAVKGDWKLLCKMNGENAQLFNLATDFDEKMDVAAQQKEVVANLAAELQAHIERQQTLRDGLGKPEVKPAIDVDPQLQDQLKALGYLE